MKIFEKFILGNLILENRIVLPPLVTRLSGDDGLVNDGVKKRYLRYAKGDVGFIVTEAISVISKKSGPFLRLSEEKYILGLKEMVEEVHNESHTKIAPQLIHFLRISRSGYREKFEDLKTEDIKTIPSSFANATLNARKAGLDAVELHMAHAYTLSSSLSMLNSRQDEYGKNIDGRMRLMTEVIEHIRKEVGKDFVVGARINGEDFVLNGNTLEQTRIIAKRLAELGIDYISVSAGGKFEDAIPKQGEPLDPYTGYSGTRCMPPEYMPDCVNVYLAEDIKRTINKAGFTTPVITAGKIRTPEQAESILQENRADLVGLGRTILCDPDWPIKVRENRWNDVRRCTSCNTCLKLDMAFKPVFCIEWPKGYMHAP